MKLQNIFTSVVHHLQKQGVRSLDNGDACAYRGERGRKCAIGAIIPDRLYHEHMEGKRANAFIYPLRFPPGTYHAGEENYDRREVGVFLATLADMRPKNETGVYDKHELDHLSDFLDSLQWLHDKISPDDWERALKSEAQEYGLTMPAPIRTLETV